MSTEPASDEPEATVLVVDDEPDLADLYVTWLAPSFDVRVAYDGRSALEALDPSVDVVLLDRRMPSVSGDDVLDRIRDRSIDCRVAMVTAVEPDVDIVELGFDDYLQKPVDREQLVGLVERLLRRSAYDRRLQAYFAAVSKRSLLEANLTSTERESSDAYRALETDIERLQVTVDALSEDFDDEDFAVLFKRLE